MIQVIVGMHFESWWQYLRNMLAMTCWTYQSIS